MEEITSKNSFLSVNGEKARYIKAVIRCRPGEEIIATCKNSQSYITKIISLSNNEVKLEIVGKYDLNSESPLNITLILGLLKGEKMDLVIQKATELGIQEIAPVITERAQLRQTRKLLRWQKIAEEAARQCGRNRVPDIHEPKDFTKTLTDYPGSGIIFWELGGASLSSVFERFREKNNIILCTGPEGGFSEKEVNYAEESGYITASLGKRILRAETAAIAAVSIVQYELGDVGKGF